MAAAAPFRSRRRGIILGVCFLIVLIPVLYVVLSSAGKPGFDFFKRRELPPGEFPGVRVAVSASRDDGHGGGGDNQAAAAVELTRLHAELASTRSQLERLQEELHKCRLQSAPKIANDIKEKNQEVNMPPRTSNAAAAIRPPFRPRYRTEVEPWESFVPTLW